MAVDLPTLQPEAQPDSPPEARLRPQPLLGLGLRALLMLAVLGLALLVQRAIDSDPTPTLLALAVPLLLGFGWLSLPFQLPERPAPAPLPAAPMRWRWFGAGVALALLSYWLLAPLAFSSSGLLAWVLGIALCLVGLWDGPAPWQGPLAALRALRRDGSIAMPWPWLLLALIMAVATFYRLYQLADLPSEPAPDIPLKIQIVQGILDGERPIYSTIYPGRETLFFYITALYASFFGNDQFALKLVSALFSLASIPLAYMLASRWFGRAAGLWMAAWLALAPWQIIISRIGYRGAMMPFMIVLTMAALDWVLARGARRDFALLGIVAGIGFYTYTAYQIVPVALALAWLGSLALRWPQARSRNGFERWRYLVQPRWLLTALLFGLVLLPLIHFAVNDFADFFLRAGSRITSRETPLPPDLAGTLLLNIYHSLGMFNVHGDGAYILNVPGRRSLGLASGALFLLGLGLLLLNLRRRPYALIALFLLVMQLPSALALAFPNEVPAALRASGALIPAYLLIGLPLALLGQALSQSWRGALLLGFANGPPRQLPLRWLGRATLALLAALLLAGEARETYRTYFVDYAAAQPHANASVNRAIAQALDEYAGEGPAYLRIWPYWSDVNAIRSQLRRMSFGDYSEVTAEQFNPSLFQSVAKRALFIVHPDDQGSVAALRLAFPHGALVARRSPSGEILLYTFYAER